MCIRDRSRSWFNLGIISLQPSELFKIAMIIYSADYIGNHYHELKKLKASFKLLFILGLGFGLIMLQPDFGSGVVMACSIIVMLIVSPFPFKYFVMLGILGIIGIILMIASAPYRLARIVAFLNPFADPLGSGFQIIQSLYAIAPVSYTHLDVYKRQQCICSIDLTDVLDNISICGCLLQLQIHKTV